MSNNQAEKKGTEQPQQQTFVRKCPSIPTIPTQRWSESVEEQSASAHPLQVYCRVRPLNKLELSIGGQNCFQYSLDRKRINLKVKNRLPSEKKSNFKFSHVFDEESSQNDIYNLAARPILDSVLKGYNGTIFAYG